MQAEVRIHVDASPERLYEMVSDVTRMGEWSPECYRCEWLDGATGPAEGARFKGHNRRGLLRWSTTPKVLTAEPGREFSFVTYDFRGRENTRWTYRFEPAPGGGTDVTERCEVVNYLLPLKVVAPLRLRMGQVERGMQKTLERVKAAAERP
jgi:uncharacterized protein YndB with AHSA1/START domain